MRSKCEHCGGMAIVGSTCPIAIPCPTCYAPAGASCRRPSGHACDMHAARWRTAEDRDAFTTAAYVEAMTLAADQARLDV